ncbi:Transcription repressor OFP14 [Abeliophyllum distichum]|uniref:Transcription repressor n=1 Tax=Abeliophyllum distichum TaxID=126358 RepID=A0ABD1UR93_9LAMI
MEKVRNEAEKKNLQRRKRRSSRISFSASLPEDVCGAFEDCICAVKYSTDPFSDIRESIIQVIQNLGIQDWNQMEELIYCYIALNSSEVHTFIQDAFLSLTFSTV